MKEPKLKRFKVNRKPDPATVANPMIRRQLERALENDPEEIRRIRRRAAIAFNQARAVKNDGDGPNKRRRKRRSDAGKPRRKRGSEPAAGGTVPADSAEPPPGAEET